MAKVVAVNVSEKKGTIKHAVEEVEMKEDFGIVGDSHAEQGSIRQISLLGIESINKMKEYGIGLCVGKFAENVTTEGICLYELPVGTKLKIGETLHEVTQIGKKMPRRRRVRNRETHRKVHYAERRNIHARAERRHRARRRRNRH